MQHLQVTLDSPTENLALDEALLEAAEAGEMEPSVIRLWESPNYCVVLGRSSSAEIEVNLDACRRAGVPVLRRSSGGGTILAGPGCLMYALVLDFDTYPQMRTIDQAHQFVLGRMSKILTTDRQEVVTAGISDLTFLPMGASALAKFSGNAVRLKRQHILYHGTLLYDFDLTMIQRYLSTPARMPNYRDDRQHAEFVSNFDLDRHTLVTRLLSGWHADTRLQTWPTSRTAELVKTKYVNDPKWVILAPSG